MNTQPTKRNSLEQGRAQDAYRAAEEGMKEYKKEYLSFVNDLPMLIKTNGLGAAISFATYKNKPSQLVYKQVASWLQKDDKGLIDLTKGSLAERLTAIGSSDYKAVTIEVMAWLNWLRRFAKGLDKETK